MTVELECSPQGLLIGSLLKESGLTASTSEAIRMVRQGAVRLDGERVEDPRYALLPGTDAVVQVGKRRIARVRLATGSAGNSPCDNNPSDNHGVESAAGGNHEVLK